MHSLSTDELSINPFSAINGTTLRSCLVDLTSLTEEQICMFIASRIRSARLDLGFSQPEMALKADIPLRTYKRFELSGKGTMVNLILVLRVLGKLRALEAIFPAPHKKLHVDIVERVRLIAVAAQRKRQNPSM